MVNQPTIKLHDGHMMPQLGLSVSQASIDDARSTAVTALSVGYRAIDSAANCKSEEGIGQALRETAIARDDIFIISKLCNDDQLNAQQALETSLQKLQLDNVDLYLMHWPCPQQDHYVAAWQQMIKLQQQGLTKSIGVCNFNQPHVKRLIDETGVTPVINQIELHPMLQQRTLHAWNALHHIQTGSCSPLAQGGKGVFDQETIKDLAKKYAKTPAQIVIRWHLDSGLVVIPKSVTPARIEENFRVFDFRLEKEEISDITALDRGKRLGPNPDELS